MARVTFTQKFVQHPTASRPKSGERLVRDKSTPGLALKLTPNGPRAFLYIWNEKTPQGYFERRVELGPWSADAKLSDLRTRAIEMRERTKAKLPPLATSGLTMQILWDKYKAHCEPRWRESTMKDGKSIWDVHIAPTFGARTPESITRAEVIAWHHGITVGDEKKKRKPAPGRANRVLAVLRSMLNYATHDLELLNKNPAARVGMNDALPRETFLSEAQLKKLWTLLEKFEDQRAADAVRLAILTGQRRREVLGARFSEFDLHKGAWKIPAERDKAKRGKLISIPRAAIEVVRSRLEARAEFDHKDPRRNTDLLFTETGHAPLVDLKKPWAAIREAFKMPALRFHDLRHSFASLLINKGHSLYVVGAALGHSRPETTARYAHLERETLEKAAQHVGSVFDDSPRKLPEAAE